MLRRLDELEVDLIARRQRAEEEGWQGEIEGIELTLGSLRGKRDAVNRRISRSHDLGIPTPGALNPSSAPQSG